MASGEMHIKATVVLSAPAAVAATSMGADWRGALACLVGVLSGIILSPDLDLSQRTRSEYLVSEYLGRIPGFFWYLFWWPYAKLIPHRHALSHWPILGTFGRLAYLLVFSFPIWFAANWLINGRVFVYSPLPPALREGLYWWLFGLMLADGLHYLMDVLPIFRPARRRRSRWRRIF